MDTKKPKRFKNAYMCFCVQERRNVRNQLRTCDPKRVTRELANRWRRMGAEDKRKFEAMSLVDKTRWANEMKEFRRPRAP